MKTHLQTGPCERDFAPDKKRFPVGVAFPKTHSIKWLIELLPSDTERTSALLDATVLTEYATVFRYPGELEPITEEEYQHMLWLAGSVVQWAQEEINIAGTRSQPCS